MKQRFIALVSIIDAQIECDDNNNKDFNGCGFLGFYTAENKDEAIKEAAEEYNVPFYKIEAYPC